MQPSRPLRPLALVPNLAEVMDAASAAARASGGLQGGLPPGFVRSAFTAVPQQQPAATALYPEIALFSQIGQFFPQMQELGQFQQQGAGAEAGRASNSRGRTKSSDSKNSSAYASRHQAAEQRRRTRINERYCLLLLLKYR